MNDDKDLEVMDLVNLHAKEAKESYLNEAIKYFGGEVEQPVSKENDGQVIKDEQDDTWELTRKHKMSEILRHIELDKQYQYVCPPVQEMLVRRSSLDLKDKLKKTALIVAACVSITIGAKRLYDFNQESVKSYESFYFDQLESSKKYAEENHIEWTFYWFTHSYLGSETANENTLSSGLKESEGLNDGRKNG